MIFWITDQRQRKYTSVPA